MDPLVDQVAKRIAEAIRPRQIMLFGSRATGRARPDSDLDLLIVYSGGKSKQEVKRSIQRLFPARDFAMDLFVLTPNELETYRHVANTLAREGTERGIACDG
ncbi:MAG TPA: nucleotidyltransferase domain-containing protein [Candidatus Sumerlaeota bacterium]|nr:nucleotidyltransferase domain-containing protein [Candidatus Sumerlaeota bacterium]HOR27638.1 nucleotidyltransferase domain-containing protein [Candidatus Sumerlaeota bacterium]HPK01764.1 nucleotidyltransferase domain-containing protein [Candidatus Sumerlaeota bacterium]